MATAEDLRREFMNHMDAKGIKYTVFDEDDNIVYLAFGGDKETFVLVDFDEEGNNASSVHFLSQNFAKADRPNIPAALVKLNEINKSYRWVKFYMSDEGEISADCDAVIQPGSVGPECLEITIRMSNIIEGALDKLAGVAEINKEAKQMLDIVALMKRMS